MTFNKADFDKIDFTESYIQIFVTKHFKSVDIINQGIKQRLI